MQSIEITGKSLEEAKKAAAAKLGVSADELEVTVLEETKGLFGKSTVRISAQAKAAPEAPKPKAAKEKPAPKAEAKAEPVAEIQESFEAPAPAEAAPEEKKGGRSRRGGGREKAAAKPAAESAPESSGGEEENGDSRNGGPSATEQDAEQLCDLVKMLVASAELDVTVSGSSFDGRYVNIELDGRDVAHLVGKHGEVLNAIQYLVNIIAGKKYNNGIRATLDGNNYRQRREEALYTLATRVADEVKNRGEEAVLTRSPPSSAASSTSRLANTKAFRRTARAKSQTAA